MPHLLPLFLKLSGRRVLVVGAGAVAAGKIRQLIAAGAEVHVVAPDVSCDVEKAGAPIERRRFEPDDVAGAWLVVAAATPEVNRAVAEAAEARRVFVNAVDDPANASAYLSGIVRRGEVSIAISTGGAAPALTSLLREGLDAILPADLDEWVRLARREREMWKREDVAIADRRVLLLKALNQLYSEGAWL